MIPRAISMGGSEGSIPVLTDILQRLPPDFSAPVFVVVHVGANGRNLLADVFSQVSTLPVVTAAEGAMITPGT